MLPKKTYFAILIFALALITIVNINIWISKQVSDINRSSTPINQPPKMEAVKFVKLKPVVIDPLNDPLSPIVKKKPQKSISQPSARHNLKKTYEMPLDDVILIQ